MGEVAQMSSTVRVLLALRKADPVPVTYLNLTKKAQIHPAQLMPLMETFEEQGLVTVDRSKPPAMEGAH